MPYKILVVDNNSAGDGGGFHKNEFIELRTSLDGLIWTTPTPLLMPDMNSSFSNWAAMMPTVVREDNHWNLFYTAVQVDEVNCDYTKRFGGKVSDSDNRCIYPNLARAVLRITP